MSVRMRHTRGHTRNRRAHHNVDIPRLSVCTECKATHIRHKMCSACGMYRGRIVVDMEKINKRQEERKQKKKELLQGQDPSATNEDNKKQEDQKLDPEELSKTSK